jgi:hypothetical protein
VLRRRSNCRVLARTKSFRGPRWLPQDLTGEYVRYGGRQLSEMSCLDSGCPGREHGSAFRPLRKLQTKLKLSTCRTNCGIKKKYDVCADQIGKSLRSIGRARPFVSVDDRQCPVLSVLPVPPFGGPRQAPAPPVSCRGCGDMLAKAP